MKIGVEQTDALETAHVTTGAGTSISVSFNKCGNVVQGRINNGSFTVSADGTLFTIPQGYRPVNYYEFLDTYSKKRIYIDKNGNAKTYDAISSAVIRGSFTYIAAPTT